MKLKRKIYTPLILLTGILILHIIKNSFNSFYIEEAEDFATVFTSIMIDAVPFVIIGSFISAMIQIYVSQDVIKKFIPKNIIAAYFEMAVIGCIMPVCECAIVPITRRLIKKGLPCGLGVTFMLAVPIVNPVVILSTYYAFYDHISAVILRTCGGVIASIAIGVIVNFICRKDQIINENYSENESFCTCGCSDNDNNKGMVSVIRHTNREFLEITQYLIYGAFLSSIFQVISNTYNITGKINNNIISIIFMMFLSFALSLCSEADAFVAKSFLSSQGLCACIGFMLLGPMLDLKNLIILLGTFKKKFVIKFSITTVIIVYLISMIFLIFGF